MIGHMIAAAALCAGAAGQQDPQSKKKALSDLNLVGTWVYDDLNAGLTEAKKTSKPMLVVIR